MKLAFYVFFYMTCFALPLIVPYSYSLHSQTSKLISPVHLPAVFCHVLVPYPYCVSCFSTRWTSLAIRVCKNRKKNKIHKRKVVSTHFVNVMIIGRYLEPNKQGHITRTLFPLLVPSGRTAYLNILAARIIIAKAVGPNFSSKMQKPVALYTSIMSINLVLYHFHVKY